MKKIYLMFLVVFLVGGLAAQSATSTTTTNVKATKKEKTAAVNSIAGNTNVTAVTQTNTQLADLPGFPVFQNTGNKELDNANYAIAKENWIKENQAAYDAFVGNTSTTPIISGNETNITDLPGFPQYTNTGNTEVDKANYRAAKELWIQNNQELYNNAVKVTESNNESRRTSTNNK